MNGAEAIKRRAWRLFKISISIMPVQFIYLHYSIFIAPVSGDKVSIDGLKLLKFAPVNKTKLRRHRFWLL